MNFVDPKEYDIPGLVRKNRYKTILPSKFPDFKSLKQGGLFHMLEGLCTFLSRMHQVCCNYHVLSEGHIYEAATWLQSINQISKEVQSMKNLRFTEHQQHLGI